MPGKTREKILQATEKLVQMRGLARVTTREIAQETGLSEGALYRHFGHKEEVFFEILMKYLPPLLDMLKMYAPGTGTVSENLEAIALATISYYEHLIPMGASFLADTELLLQYRKALQRINAGPDKFVEVFVAYIEEEQQLGRIEKYVPALSIAIQLLGACFQYEFLRQFTGDLPFNQTAREFVHMLVQSLAPDKFPLQ